MRILVRWHNHLELTSAVSRYSNLSLDLQTPPEILPLLLLLEHSEQNRPYTVYESTAIIAILRCLAHSILLLIQD